MIFGASLLEAQHERENGEKAGKIACVSGQGTEGDVHIFRSQQVPRTAKQFAPRNSSVWLRKGARANA